MALVLVHVSPQLQHRTPWLGCDVGHVYESECGYDLTLCKSGQWLETIWSNNIVVGSTVPLRPAHPNGPQRERRRVPLVLIVLHHCCDPDQESFFTLRVKYSNSYHYPPLTCKKACLLNTTFETKKIILPILELSAFVSSIICNRSLGFAICLATPGNTCQMSRVQLAVKTWSCPPRFN